MFTYIHDTYEYIEKTKKITLDYDYSQTKNTSELFAKIIKDFDAQQRQEYYQHLKLLPYIFISMALIGGLLLANTTQFAVSATLLSTGIALYAYIKLNEPSSVENKCFNGQHYNTAHCKQIFFHPKNEMEKNHSTLNPQFNRLNNLR